MKELLRNSPIDIEPAAFDVGNEGHRLRSLAAGGPR